MSELHGRTNKESAPCSYSVAMAEVNWWPCCWPEAVGGPAVAMAAGGLKVGVAAGCWEEEEGGASCSLEEAADLLKNPEKTFRLVYLAYRMSGTFAELTMRQTCSHCQWTRTHVMSVRSSLSHGRRRGLHPGRGHADGVVGQGGASHVGHRGRVVVVPSVATVATVTAVHVVEVSVRRRARVHPGRSALLKDHRQIRHLPEYFEYTVCVCYDDVQEEIMTEVK